MRLISEEGSTALCVMHYSRFLLMTFVVDQYPELFNIQST